MLAAWYFATGGAIGEKASYPSKLRARAHGFAKSRDVVRSAHTRASDRTAQNYIAQPMRQRARWLGSRWLVAAHKPNLRATIES
jgi:hypothetical protein